MRYRSTWKPSIKQKGKIDLVGSSKVVPSRQNITLYKKKGLKVEKAKKKKKGWKMVIE